MNEQVDIKWGLAGVVADETVVSKVMQEINSLTYRGYPVQDLAEACCFEEVAYLLLYGELPSKTELDDFTKQERQQRTLSPEMLSIIRLLPKDAHPMDSLRTCVSLLGMEDSDAFNIDVESNNRKSIQLLARIPTMIAAAHHCANGREPIAPSADLPMSENFFHMYFGKVPGPDVVKAFDVTLTLYAEHGFNASTFAARVVTSSISDMYSAVTAAIGSLKGPLHGGANEAVMRTLHEIGDASRAAEWIANALARKQKVMGFGHRVYTHGDSRGPTMKKYMLKMAASTGGQKWVDISEILEKTMIEEKGIYPNLDFTTGPAYHMMGIDTKMFTPIFVMSRITGWCAHIMEQTANNRLIRPLCHYVGVDQRSVVPLDQRG